MGKMFSKPKMPSSPPMPVVTALPAPEIKYDDPVDSNDPPDGAGGGNSDNAPEVTPDEQRVQNILTRKRGRLGTIATSFNGILNSETANTPIRKTLLGE